MGIAFQAISSAENIGYIIPVSHVFALDVEQQITVFSRIEAVASINFFSKSAASFWERILFTVFSVIISGSLICYQLCNESARCHCLELYLLHDAGFYLLSFYLSCGLYLRAPSILENTVYIVSYLFQFKLYTLPYFDRF